MTTATQSPEIRRIRSEFPWHGRLTLANADAIADRIRGLIGAGQRYTRVTSNAAFDHHQPRVRTGCAADSVKVWHEPFEGKPMASIDISDEYLLTLITQASDQQTANDGAEKDRPPHIAFGRTQFTVTDYTPSGHLFYVVFAVEEREP